MVIQHQMTDFRGHFKQRIGRLNPWILKAHGGCDNTHTYLHAVSTFIHITLVIFPLLSSRPAPKKEITPPLLANIIKHGLFLYFRGNAH